MASVDEDALVCDFAETYGIYDYRSLPVTLAATYAAGLRENSRIKTKMNGMVRPFDEYILAAIYDGINWLCWTKTKDGSKGVNMPGRMIDLFFGDKDKQKSTNDFETFENHNAFETKWSILAGEYNE